jgi:hypothetical protein
MVAFMDEAEAIRPPRQYVVPQVPLPSEFVFPYMDVNADPVAATMNEFNKFKNKIYDEDRDQYNQALNELNLRNKRRYETLGHQYEDLIKYGMAEANRRVRRSLKLNELKEARSEPWWPAFVEEFPETGKSAIELVYVEMLTKVPTFKEDTIGSLYRDGLMRFGDARKFRDIIFRINELSGALPEYKLLMVFKDIEARVRFENKLGTGIASSGSMSVRKASLSA